MKPLVCIAMEVKTREFDPLLYLSMHCIQKGFPVLLGARSRVWRFFRKDSENIPIFYLAKEMIDLVKYITPDMTVFSLDEEGGDKYAENGEVRLHPVGAQEHLSHIFAWGERYREYMIDHGGNPDKILATG